MKMETIALKMELVDEQGIIREIEITLRREAGIRILVSFPEYCNENGHITRFIGQLVPKDTEHPRVDISKIERLGIANA